MPALDHSIATERRPEFGAILRDQWAPPVVSQLPEGLSPHRVVILQSEDMREQNVAWMLRRLSDGWYFIGGPALFDEVVDFEVSPGSTFDDLATVGPQVSIPAAGDYLVQIRARVVHSSGSFTPFIGFTGPGFSVPSTDYDTAIIITQDQSNIDRESSVYFTGPGLVTMKYRDSNGSGSFLERILMITPKRLDLG